MKFIRWIINILKKENQQHELPCTEEKSDLDYLDVGDVIWAKRYKTENEKNKIAIGHQTGPYIIIKKTNDKIYGIYCSSNPEIIDPIIKRKLNKLDYTAEKDNFIWINFIEEITTNTYLKTIGKIDNNSLDLINKYIYIGLIHNKTIKNYKYEDIKINYTIGDIIIFNNIKYYIYKLDNNNYYCYQLNKTTNDNKQGIKINKKRYLFDFNNVTITKNSNISLYEVLDEENQNIVNKLKLKTHEEEKYKNNLESGNLIEYNDKLYYIFGNYKQELLTYKIYNKKIDNTKPIIINKKRYYADFIETKIDKNPNKIKVISRISPVEEIELKKQKKLVKNKNSENNNKNNKYKKFTIRTIIINNETLNKYVIIERNDNTIVLYDLNKDELYKLDIAKELDNFTKVNIQSNIDFQNILIKIKNNNRQY